MSQPPVDEESYLSLLSRSIPQLHWWKFDLTTCGYPKHLWISLPHGVQIVSARSSLLPSDSTFLGSLNIFSQGEDCSISGIRITPSQHDQMVCIETRGSDHQSQIIWIDVNRPAVVTTSGNQKVDVRKPTQIPPGSQIYGWLSGLEVPSSAPRIITDESFLIPVDFNTREDVAVVLSRHPTLHEGESLFQSQLKSGKLIFVNPQTEVSYRHPFELSAHSSLENNESLRGGERLQEVGEDLEFPASMADEQTSKSEMCLSETLVEIEDLFNRVIWIIQHPSDDTPTRDKNVEDQRRRITMQLDEMRNNEEASFFQAVGELGNNESDGSLSLLDKLLSILTCLLEIGEMDEHDRNTEKLVERFELDKLKNVMVNKHRRVDSHRLQQLVEHKIPELTAWTNQSKTNDVRLSLASQTCMQMTCIQSALTCFLQTDQSDIDLNPMISKVKLLLDDCIENEINEKLENQPGDDRLHFSINDVLSNFMATFSDCLSEISSMKFSQNQWNSNLLQFLQQISANLVKNADFLKTNCAWISCILDEEVSERLEISQQIYAHLKILHNNALKTYKHLIIRSRLVCEHSGLQALATRLNRLTEQCSQYPFSQWEICQMEKELDSCETECVLEVLCTAEGYEGFVQEVVDYIRKAISSIRKILSEVEISQELSPEELTERFNLLTQQAQQTSTFETLFEAILVGWLLQITSTSNDRLNEWICELEKRAAENFQNTQAVECCAALVEEFIRQIPSTLPSNVEALSLRETHLVLSNMTERGNIALQLLERLAFLTNLHDTQRIDDLRLAYSGAVESLLLCLQALNGVLREVLEWRNCLLVTANMDQVVASTQNVIDSINFAIDVLTQETTRTEIIGFANAPDFLSKTLAWLSNLPTSLTSFPTIISEAQLQKSAVYKHIDAFLQQLLDLEWRMADSGVLLRKDLYKEIDESSAGRLQSKWLTDISEMQKSIDITKRRTFLNIAESLERSVRTRSTSLFILLAGSREVREITHGFSMVDFIVSMAENLQDVDLQKLRIESDNSATWNDKFEDKFLRLRPDSFFELMKSTCAEHKQILKNKNNIETNLQLSNCLKRSEVLSKIGIKWFSVLKQPPYVINRILCCHWPKVVKWLIHFNQSQLEPTSCPDWCNYALKLRNIVARSLFPDNLHPDEFQQIRVLIENALKDLHRSIESTESILNGIPVDFQLQYDDVWQPCSRLLEITESYLTLLDNKTRSLTSHSLPKVEKDLQYLEYRLNGLAKTTTSVSHTEDCSNLIVQLERSLRLMRHMSRILFTCLAGNHKTEVDTRPPEHLDVDELYKRAVKLVRDYEDSEIGRQIVEAWKKLQSVADKLGLLQAGLPLNDIQITGDPGTAQPPTNARHFEDYSNASMARKRSWTLLEVLGPHECLYPGCRGKKSGKHADDDENGNLLHELHTLYSILCSDFHNPAKRISYNALASESSDIILMKLRVEWHRDNELVNQFNSLQRRVESDVSVGSDIKSTFNLIKRFWGSMDTPRFITEADQKLATLSSWLCEVEEQMDVVILPRLQATWKMSSRTCPLWIVEECAYKMNEIAEDLERLQRSGMIAERNLQGIRYSLRAGWLSVREFLLQRCNKTTSDSARYFPLVDDYMYHSAKLGFTDCQLESIKNRLCNQFLLKGPHQRRPCHNHSAGKRFCSTRRPIRSLFLPSKFTNRCRLVNDRPPIALTIHSLPDISSELYPTSEPTFHSPRCASLNFQPWMSLPEIRPHLISHRKRIESSFSIVEEDADSTKSPFFAPQEARVSISKFSFFPSQPEEGKIGEVQDLAVSIDQKHEMSAAADIDDSLKRASLSELEKYSSPVTPDPIPSKIEMQ
ncbi:hypothetical protein Aperf_G00000058828 [Anoplocephala perfoliata]